MANPSITFTDRRAYFHSLSKVSSHNNQSIYESLFSDGHRITSKDVWMDSISFCPTENLADSFASTSPNIIRKHTKVTLIPVDGTNNQLYRVVLGGKWINNWISPNDSVNSVGETSQGFACKIYQNNDTLISLTEGVHIRNYFNGLIEFEVGYTPINLGYSTPLKITFYEYVGTTLADGGIVPPTPVETFPPVCELFDFKKEFDLNSNNINYFGEEMIFQLFDEDGNQIQEEYN